MKLYKLTYYILVFSFIWTSCCDDKTGSLDINIKLKYNGDPLVMFDSYAYPDGKKIDFTRFSFYTSEMKLDETLINEVEFHNLTNSHSTIDLSNTGYNWTIENIPTGNYNALSFNVGIPANLNEMDPGEFPSGHPLAKPSENWFSWNSYIFLKVEGNIDLDNDGDAETGVALHLGADEALRNLSFNSPISIDHTENSRIELIIDLYKLFDGSSRIYPIEDNPQIHNLIQMDAVIELSNNIENTIIKN